MNRNLFFDPIALRANAVPATVESSGRVGCGYAKLANDGEDRSCCFRSRLEFSTVTQSSIPETLKKYPCSGEK